MTTIVSQITSLTVVYSTVYSDADQRKHKSSASLAFVWGIHRDRWIPRTKGQLRGKCFHLMTSSWISQQVPKLSFYIRSLRTMFLKLQPYRIGANKLRDANGGLQDHLPISHDDVIKWKHFPRDWPFVRGIHRSPHKGHAVTRSFDVFFNLRLN